MTFLDAVFGQQAGGLVPIEIGAYGRQRTTREGASGHGEEASHLA